MRQVTTELTSIMRGVCETHSTLALTMRDGTMQYHATGAGIVANLPNRPNTAFSSNLISVETIRQSLTSAVDNVSVQIQNVDKIFFVELMRSDRRIESATAEIGRVWRKSTSDAWTYQTLFTGKVTTAKANIIRVELEITSLFASVGAIIAARPHSARCALIYKSPECGSTSTRSTCDKQLNSLNGCNIRHRFAGFNYPGNPVNQTPGSDPSDTGGVGGDGGGTGGSGGGGGYDSNCFVDGTLITLANGKTKPIENIRIGDKVLCFDSETDEITTSFVIDKFENLAQQSLKVTFADGSKVEVTPLHKFFRSWLSDRQFVEIGKLTVFDWVNCLRNGDWHSKTIWQVELITESRCVHNFTVAKYHTYFANGFAVSNSKRSPFETQTN